MVCTQPRRLVFLSSRPRSALTKRKDVLSDLLSASTVKTLSGQGCTPSQVTRASCLPLSPLVFFVSLSPLFSSALTCWAPGQPVSGMFFSMHVSGVAYLEVSCGPMTTVIHHDTSFHRLGIQPE